MELQVNRKEELEYNVQKRSTRHESFQTTAENRQREVERVASQSAEFQTHAAATGNERRPAVFR
jgi:hypothetical protein